MNKITIQKVPDKIADYLRHSGVSSEGNKFLKAGKIMKDAGILEHLIMMYDNQNPDTEQLLELIEKSVSIGRIIRGESPKTPVQPVTKEPDPEPEENDPPPVFGA